MLYYNRKDIVKELILLKVIAVTNPARELVVTSHLGLI